MYILATYRHQISQVDYDGLRRKRLAGGSRRAGIFAATAFHAGVKAEQLLTIEVRKSVNSSATCLLDLFHIQGNQRAHGPLGTTRNVKRASDHVEKPIHRNRGEEHGNQNRVPPPGRQMHCLGGRYVDSAQQVHLDQPADDRPARQTRLYLRVMKSQCFHRETGDA